MTIRTGVARTWPASRNHGSVRCRSRVIQPAIAFVTFVTTLLVGCGGSSSSSSQPPPPPPGPSFTIVVTPSSPSIAPGTSSTIQVSVTPDNGFTGSVSIKASGLPTGLTLSPSSLSVQNTPQTATLTATSTLANGNYSFSLSGTSGTINSSTTVNVTAGALANFVITRPLSSQVVTRFGGSVQLALGTTPQGLGSSNYLVNFSLAGLPTGVIATFSPVSAMVGSSTTLTLTAPSNPQWIQNQPFAVIGTPTAGVSQQSVTLDLVIAPLPGNIPNNRTGYLRTDDSPKSIAYDSAHGLIYASEYLLNRVDAVSTATRQIVRSIPVMSPREVALTVDGSAVLVGSDAQQIVSISTSSLQVQNLWKLPRLAGMTYGTQALHPLSDGTVAINVTGVNGGISKFAIWNPNSNSVSTVTLPAGLSDAGISSASANGAQIVVADSAGPAHIAIYDAATKTFSTPLQFPGFIYYVAASPSGDYFIVSDDTYGIGLYDSQLQGIALLSNPDGYSTGSIFSPDGSRIYVVSRNDVPQGVIGVFDGNSGNFINTAPVLGTIPPGVTLAPSPFVETPFAVDDTGIVFGSADHGIAFDDANYSVNFVFGFNGPPILDMIPSPGSGRINESTSTTFQSVIDFNALPDVWFGDVRASEVTSGLGLSATAPTSPQSGPVSIKLIEPDGIEVFNPLVFSYGPGVMFLSGDEASPNGGATFDIIGVGLPTDPTQIQVTVGGQNANVVSATSPTFDGRYFPFTYPYPAVDVKVALPPGSGDEDLTVTTSSGTATLAKAIHYVQSVTDYSSTDTFRAILLDRKRNQLYLSAGDHIDVFSLATMTFLSPFTPPALNGQKGFHGLALTPDGSELIVANFPDGSVALINLDAPSSATAVQAIPTGALLNPGPENVVTTKNGTAFIEPMISNPNIVGAGASLYELDLSTLQLSTATPPGVGLSVQGYPVAASGDGSKVLVGSPPAIYDVASNVWSTNNTLVGYSAAIDLNGLVYGIGYGFVDASADFLGYLAWQDVFQAGLGYPLPLEKIPDGGSLIYNVNPGSIDIYDVNHGALLHRLSLAEQLQNVTDAMAIDAYGKTIYLITNRGLSIVQLNNAPLAIGSVVPAAGPSGTTVTLHGSGFQSATAVTVGGASATSTEVDPNTLQVVIPSSSSGPVQISVTNPSGESYSLDDAFTVQ